LRSIGQGLSEDALTGLSANERAALDGMLTRVRANLSNDDTNEAANG
jgi:hypothetical protein